MPDTFSIRRRVPAVSRTTITKTVEPPINKEAPGSGASGRSSRANYRDFAERYRQRRLDELDEHTSPAAAKTAPRQGLLRGRRREYLRDYLRWLWP